MNMEAEKYNFTLIVQESVGKYGIGQVILPKPGSKLIFQINEEKIWVNMLDSDVAEGIFLVSCYFFHYITGFMATLL